MAEILYILLAALYSTAPSLFWFAMLVTGYLVFRSAGLISALAVLVEVDGHFQKAVVEDQEVARRRGA